MSVQNRNLTKGTYTVKYESKLSVLLSKAYCFFKGHKEVTLIDKKYCICCWKEMKE